MQHKETLEQIFDYLQELCGDCHRQREAPDIEDYGMLLDQIHDILEDKQVKQPFSIEDIRERLPVQRTSAEVEQALEEWLELKIVVKQGDRYGMRI